MVIARVLAVSCLVACSYSPQPATPEDGTTTDTMQTDTLIDTGTCAGWQSGLLVDDPCTLTPQAGPVLSPNASPYTYDTTVDGGVLTDMSNTVIATSAATTTQADGSIAALFVVDTFSVPANVEIQVVGTKPLIVVSFTTVTITGFVDASSQTGEIDAIAHIDGPRRVGAGSDRDCLGSQIGGNGTVADNTGGSGAGAGGAFQGNGGNGGIGDVADGGNNPGGTGGAAITMPLALRGGCRGGNSGAAGTNADPPSDQNTVTRGGGGGGAIGLVAKDAITIAGAVAAGGAGGGGPQLGAANGGGGGGSGGMVVLDSASLTLTNAKLAANGGGGGAGSGFDNDGAQGVNATANSVAAPGGLGAGGGCGISGAAGSAGLALAGGSITMGDDCGGGGGGGGAGFIVFFSGQVSQTNPTISPGAITVQ